MPIRLSVLVLVATLAAGCGGSSTTASLSASPTAAGSAALPLGKELVALEQRTYRSPDGFVPALTVDVDAGWSSVHRNDDAFDLTQPDPARDAPLVAVVWMTPPEPTAAAALAAVKSAAGAAAHPVQGRIGTAAAAGLDITGGSGQVVASVRQGIALDAAPGQRLRVLAAEVGGKPLVAVILVPVAASFDALAAKAQVLLDSVRPT